jgi:hypothetical protein
MKKHTLLMLKVIICELTWEYVAQTNGIILHDVHTCPESVKQSKTGQK